MDGMADFESVGRGSIPRRGAFTIMSSECAGSARDRAKVVDQVRFLARTLLTTLEPDGTAIGCNPIEVGSTPTGVSPNRGLARQYS